MNRVRRVVAGVIGLGLVLAGPVTAASAEAGSAAASTPAAGLDVSIGGWAENALVLPDGDVLVANLGANRVQRIDGETHEISTVAEVAAPGGLAVDGSTLYVVTGNVPTFRVDARRGCPRPRSRVRRTSHGRRRAR